VNQAKPVLLICQGVVGRAKVKSISTGMKGMQGIEQGHYVKGNGTQIKSDASHTRIFADQAKSKS